MMTFRRGTSIQNCAFQIGGRLGGWKIKYFEMQMYITQMYLKKRDTLKI